MSGPVLPDAAVRAASEHVERVVAGLALPRGRRRELRDAPRLPWTDVREASLLENSGDLARATPWLALTVGLALTLASTVRASWLPALIRASHLAAASWMACAGSAAVYGFARLSLAPHSVGDAIKLALVLVFLITSAVFVAETAAWRGAKVLRRYVRDGVREAVRIGTGT
jgi:hypothetical protein